MTRLVDYIVIAGYEHEKKLNQSGFVCQGKIIQRFPVKDWSDSPFIEGIELFCQPNGWVLTPEKQEPKFYTSVLTDIEGRRHFCACLSFSEAVSKETLGVEKSADEEVEDGTIKGSTRGRSTSLPRHIVPGISLPALAHDAVMFAPKCLVIVSRHDCQDTFRNCLGVIYTAYSECLVGPGGERIKLETLVGNILGSVYVPPPGGPQIRFSLGATDKMTLQPPMYPHLPVTGTKVALLFQQLGIRSVLRLFCAAMTEQKILFFSQSFSRLTDSCMALIALMYPMKYSHVFIPILPSALLEVLSTPTPFIIGVNSIHEPDISDLLDVVIVDLDGGSITLPDNLTINQLDEPLLSKVLSELSMVLNPELSLADNAFFSNSPVNRRPAASLDKELRAVMLRLMVQLLEGYRSCLTLVRIHPKPFITFHKAAFLGRRNQCDSEFLKRVLDCMFFNTFVSERGPPWRQCDIFDEQYSNFGELAALERTQGVKTTLRHIQILAEELYRNENPMTTVAQPYAQKIPQPAEGAMTRVHQPIFPTIDVELVSAIINAGIERNRIEVNSPSTNTTTLQLVPMGQVVSKDGNHTAALPNSARRLEVLRNCIASIFENKIADAKKTFPAVISALKTKQARVALCEELAMHRMGNQVMLEHQQFDMVVRLMNAALQDDSDMDEFGIAAMLLPMSTVFGRKLTKGVIQFVYTLIQDHAVWQNQQFWEATFFNDVQKGIKTLYLSLQDQNYNNKSLNASAESSHVSATREVRKSALYEPNGKSVLELAAQEMRRWDMLDESMKKELMTAEEQTVYSQAFDYTNKMICLLCPLDASPKRGGRKFDEYENHSNSISNSVAESDSIDAESGFEDQEIPDQGQNVIRFVSRFADKVCSESQVTEDHMKAVSQMIPGAVAMHLEQLEDVCKQAKRLPPIQKSKIHVPSLLPGEELITPNGLRVYLLSDGREDLSTGLNLLPAEGALFLSTYRIIFRGTPIDPFAAEHTVTRFFPVTSLTREKRFTINEYLTEIEQQLKEGIQLRSNTFQLIRAAFDEEVTNEDVEIFRRNLQHVQYPETIFHFFAFRGRLAAEPLSKGKEKHTKYSTIRGLASKTLKGVSRVTGVKSKTRKSSNKYLLPNMLPPMHGRLSLTDLHHESSKIDEEDSDSEVHMHPAPNVLLTHQPPSSMDSKTLERLMDRSYFKDWQRLGLIANDYTITTKVSQHESFRVSTANYRYGLAQSYPALLLVPTRINDDSLRKYSRCHRLNRFPSITWKHPKNSSLLLRGAGFHGRGVMSMIRRHQDGQTSSGQAELTSSLEAELYISAIVQTTPRAMIRPESTWNMAGSDLSLNSIAMSDTAHTSATLAPSMARKFTSITRTMDTLTRNAGLPRFGRLSISNMKADRGRGSQTSLASTGLRASYRGPGDGESEPGINAILTRASLYIFGDKSQVKGVKLDSHPKTEFIPVEFAEPRRLRASFKKLMRACVPSAPSTQPDQTFLKMVEASEWLNYLQSVMQLSGAVVDLIDIQGASVMLCLEDGWDVTAQIASIAQLCMDPFYRTLEGFRVLVEKEWLALGHRFNHRSNLSNSNQDYGFTPHFLQFLDIVHQIHSQFPMSFEFNQYYIRFLAYHHVSCRFRTFLCDNEFHRYEAGFFSNKNGSIPKHHYRQQESHSSDEELDVGGGTGKRGPAASLPGNNLGINIFDYIDRLSSKSPIFRNFVFSPDLQQKVLRPFSHISDLRIWDYFLGEELKHGASYDVELFQLDLQQEEDFNPADSSMETHNTREIITAGYDCLPQVHLDSCSYLLQEIAHLESELGHLPTRWHHHWDKLEVPPPVPPRDSSVPLVQTTPSLYARQHGRIMHKRSTMELLMRGKMGAHTSAADNTAYANPHRFEKYNYTTPTYCEHCSSVMWGPVKTGLKCQDCGYSCHDKCRESVRKACTKYKQAAMPRDATAENLDRLLGQTEADLDGRKPIDNHRGLFNASNNENENSQIVMQGYLYKQANFRIKGWKQRWFVLDTTKYELRYYDTREDFQCKGVIELREVTRVTEGSSTPGANAPKRSEDRCFFDLQTFKRTYCFCADSREHAQEWIQKIQSCLQ